MKISKLPKYLKDVITGETKINFTITHKSKQLPENIFKIDTTGIQQDNKNKYSTLVAIDGIAGFAGSSAITDFLGEFSNCTVYGGVDMRENPERGSENDFEVDFFRDTNGILELEKICLFENDRIVNTAIKNFEQDVLKRYNPNHPLFNDNYIKASQTFINNLIEMSYTSNFNQTVYFSKKLTVKQYRNLAKKYISEILKDMPSKEYLVLDNLASIVVPDSDILNDYFGKYKLLASWRDPRDLYTAARNLSGNDWVPKDPEAFVKWYKWYFTRYLSVKNDNLLLIRFEDFVYHYEETSKKICDFLKLSQKNQEKKFAYFNPKISINNIGLYKNYSDQKAIDYITTNLKKYLYTLK